MIHLSLASNIKKNDRFFFRVNNPNLTSDLRCFFNCSFFPQDENFIEKTNYNNEIAAILENFEIWIDLLQEYDDIDLDESDAQTKIYEEEFYDEFEILDEDAYTVPFEHQRQLILYDFLTYIEKELKNQSINDLEIESIINETEEFKNSIQDLSKNIAITKLSRLFARIKKKGIKLFIEILGEAKKEIIKKVLTGGLDELGSHIHHIF
jgi:hypothetical protein